MTQFRSVIKLTEQGHAALNPVLRGPAGGQHHGDDEVGGVSCGGEGSSPLTGLVQRTDVQSVLLTTTFLFS